MIDAHHHLWDPDRFHYPWLEQQERAAPIRRRVDVEELRAVTAGHGVEGTVVIQARAALEETRTLLAIAAANPLVVGVVGWADLTDPALGDTLAGLRGEPGGDRLCGIRIELDQLEPDWLARPDVVRGLRTLAAADLTYDALAGARELDAVAVAARAVPDLRVVVDHLGKPDVEAGRDESWAAAMRTLGALPNVWCKVSAGWPPFESGRAEGMAPWVAQVREWFGDGRLIFGSDWPVCTLRAPYDAVLGFWQELLADLSPADHEATFAGNARAIYRLR